MKDWTVFPAIDLRDGHVVRLTQGDPARQTTYDRDPLAAAQRWQAAGATWAHVVNLSGAFGESDSVNGASLQSILTSGLSVQFGGGLRTMQSIQNALDLGVRRVVLGTAAVKDPDIVKASVDAFGAERIAVGLDLRAGVPQTHGWTQPTKQSAVALAKKWADRGLCWLILTDVHRDGTGAGVNITVTTELATATGLSVIASGGVASLTDVRNAYRAGLAGIIIGRALYEGQLDLREALSVSGDQEARLC